jgi:hypothetical protein
MALRVTSFSAIEPGHFTRTGLSVAVHALLIGVPIALFTRRAQEG